MRTSPLVYQRLADNSSFAQMVAPWIQHDDAAEARAAGCRCGCSEPHAIYPADEESRLVRLQYSYLAYHGMLDDMNPPARPAVAPPKFTEPKHPPAPRRIDSYRVEAPSRESRFELPDESQHEQRCLCLMESFFELAHGLLNDRSAACEAQTTARSFLGGLGFDVEHLAAVPMGLFVDHDTMTDGLTRAGFTPRELRKSGLLSDSRLAGRLVGPIRGPTGKITGIWARHPHSLAPLYIYFQSGWDEGVAAFGLDVALRACFGSGSEIVLVEDLLDALLLHSKGMLNAVAMVSSGNTMTARRWEYFASLGVGRATLVLDNRRFSRRRSLAAAEEAFCAETAPAVRVLPPEALGNWTSAGEFVRANTIASFKDLLKRKSVSAYRYKALDILGRHRSGVRRPQTADRAALDEAIDFYASHSGRHRTEMDTHFVPTIVDRLNLGWSVSRPLPAPRPLPTRHTAEVPRIHRSTMAAANALLRKEADSLIEDVPFFQPASLGVCELHHCEETDCFCFD